MSYIFFKNKLISNKSILSILFLYFIISSVFVLFIQFHIDIFGYFGIGGVFVNDTLGMQGNIFNAVEYGVGVQYRTIFGIILLYYPSYWIPFLYNYLINAFLIMMATIFFIRTLNGIGISLSRNKVYLVLFFVLSGFYVFGVMYHPNKEIPLITLTNAFIYYFIVQRKLILSVFIIVITFLFRDAYGVIMVLFFLLVNIKPLFKFCHEYSYFTLAVVICFFSLFSLGDLIGLTMFEEFKYILERNESLAGASNNIYLLKLLNNAFGSALRPQWLDTNDRLYLAGIGLWQFGLLLMLGVISWTCILSKYKSVQAMIKIAIFIFIGLIFISIGGLPQARYMMPYIFWLVAGFLLIFSFHEIVIFFLCTAILSFMIFLFGFGSKIPLGIDIYPYSFF